jgi:uncharacterized protein
MGQVLHGSARTTEAVRHQKEPAMPVMSRLILICGLAVYQPAAVLAQSSDTVPEALRRLFESIPAPRLPDSLGFAKAGVIAMDGEGIVRVRPDAARIRVGVLSEGASPTEVAQENATRMSSVVDAVKKSVGEPALSSGTVEIRTDAATLTPIYADRGSHPAKPALNGYRANNSLRVLIRELDQRSPGFLGAIIEQANKVGANEISGPEFLVFNDAKPLVEARVNAIEDARTKAETYAKALNVRLGRVIAVKELERRHGPMPMMARSASQADAAPPIETGTNEIVARVTVVWELKQD